MIDDLLRKLNQATKAAGLTCAAMTAFAILQLVALSLGADARIVVFVPVVVCTGCVWIYATRVVRFRAEGFGEALSKIAAGELHTELPPAPDADVEWIRVAFSRMATSLREMTDRLKRIDVARRQLFRDLAHELGTPTATMVALADALALPEVDRDEKQRQEIVRALIDGGVRLSRLIGDVRDLGELDDPEVSLERAEADVGEVVRDAALRLSLARPDAAKLELEVEPELVAEVDTDRVEQIVVNVIANAMRHTPPEGRIRVAVGRDGASVRLAVDDSGEGVPEEMLGRLGERLLRLDASRSRRSGGSGLGLSIVRAIVDRHGGMTAFERSPLGGLRVVVRLPLEQA